MKLDGVIIGAGHNGLTCLYEPSRHEGVCAGA